jgi:hypothetical protein
VCGLEKRQNTFGDSAGEERSGYLNSIGPFTMSAGLRLSELTTSDRFKHQQQYQDSAATCQI